MRWFYNFKVRICSVVIVLCRISKEDTVDSARGQQMAEKLNEAAVTLSNPLTGIGCALGLELELGLVLPAGWWAGTWLGRYFVNFLLLAWLQTWLFIMLKNHIKRQTQIF